MYAYNINFYIIVTCILWNIITNINMVIIEIKYIKPSLISVKEQSKQ